MSRTRRLLHFGLAPDFDGAMRHVDLDGGQKRLNGVVVFEGFGADAEGDAALTQFGYAFHRRVTREEEDGRGRVGRRVDDRLSHHFRRSV